MGDGSPCTPSGIKPHAYFIVTKNWDTQCIPAVRLKRPTFNTTDVIRGQKVTWKSLKWKSTNFELRKLPQHQCLWTFCILKLFFHSPCWSTQERKLINWLFPCGWYGVLVLFKIANSVTVTGSMIVVNIAVILSLTIDSAPRGLLFFVVDSVCLSICPSVCHAAPSNRFFLFVSQWNRAIFYHYLSMWHSTKHCSSIFDLPLTPKIYSPKFALWIIESVIVYMDVCHGSVGQSVHTKTCM